MRDRQYLCPVWQFDAHDVVGESSDEDTSDVCVGHAGHRRSHAWSGFDPHDHASSRTQVEAETRLLRVVPTRRIGHIGLRPQHRSGRDVSTALEVAFQAIADLRP